MTRDPIRIVYETSTETVDKLLTRRRPAAAAMRILMAGSRMYLEVTIDDSIFDLSIHRDDKREPKGTAVVPGASSF